MTVGELSDEDALSRSKHGVTVARCKTKMSKAVRMRIDSVKDDYGIFAKLCQQANETFILDFIT